MSPTFRGRLGRPVGRRERLRPCRVDTLQQEITAAKKTTSTNHVAVVIDVEDGAEALSQRQVLDQIG